MNGLPRTEAAAIKTTGRAIAGMARTADAQDIEPKSWIVCDEGHRICFTHRGLRVGGHLNAWTLRLSRWQQTEPKAGERIDWKCATCGSAWGPVFKAEAK